MSTTEGMLDKTLVIVERLTPAPSFALTMASSIALFLPDWLASMLGIDAFRVEYRALLGWTFLVSLSVLMTWVIRFGYRKYRHWDKTRRIIMVREKHMSELTEQEAGYVAEALTNNTIHCDVSDGIAGGLVGKGIFFRSSNMFDIIGGIPYNLQPWAREMVEANPTLIEHAVERPQRSRY